MSLDFSGYTLTFSDEFTGTYLDTSVWRTKYRWGGTAERTLPSNNEKQYYADRSTQVVQKDPWTDPFRIDVDPNQAGDGILVITAQPSSDMSLTQDLPYVSGLITTDGTFSQTYGYFEICAQVPAGQGLWPAFWLLPTSGTWPPEIDVMEFLGHDTDTYYAGAHWTGSDGSHQYQTNWINTGTDLTHGFHAYGVMWTADTLTFYLDGQQVFTMATPDGMDGPMYLLANLAVGGNWPGDPDATTSFPAEYQIDYIKVWSASEPAGQTLTGTATADTLTGGAGKDKLYGLKGNDMLYGLAGDDLLAGGAGRDTLTGGAGADVLVFELVSDSTPRSKDTITDFLSGTDIIDLRLIDANTKVSGDQEFAFIGGTGFSGQAGQLRFASGVLSGDVNGDKAADLEVALTGVSSLQFIQRGHQDIIL